MVRRAYNKHLNGAASSSQTKKDYRSLKLRITSSRSVGMRGSGNEQQAHQTTMRYLPRRYGSCDERNPQRLSRQPHNCAISRYGKGTYPDKARAPYRGAPTSSRAAHPSTKSTPKSPSIDAHANGCRCRPCAKPKRSCAWRLIHINPHPVAIQLHHRLPRRRRQCRQEL